MAGAALDALPGDVWTDAWVHARAVVLSGASAPKAGAAADAAVDVALDAAVGTREDEDEQASAMGGAGSGDAAVEVPMPLPRRKGWLLEDSDNR